ncbi:hypothetical protein GCM10027174_33270 [Salinifilum aidingensis]
MDASAHPLDDIERALLATRRGRGHRDPVERGLLDRWRRWREHPSELPPWGAALRHRIAADETAALPPSGLSGRAGLLPEVPSRLTGMLLGGLVGEQVALRGPPAEDAPAADRGAAPALGQRGSALLFALEGLIRARTAQRGEDGAEPFGEVLEGLRRWMRSRGVAWADCGSAHPAPVGWLIRHDALWSRSVDEPGLLTAVSRIAAGSAPGTPQHRLTGSDGATAVPLGALAPLWSADAGRVRVLGGELAALTHGHPRGHGPAAVLAVAMARLLRGQGLDTAIERGLAAWEAGRAQLSRAVELGRASPAGLRPGRVQWAALGPGRDGLSTLAAAVRTALACRREAGTPAGFAAALTAACEHDGDGPAAAALCGQLLGALHGPTAVPWPTLAPVELVERIATDAVTEFGPHPDGSADWTRRYGTAAPAPAEDSARPRGDRPAGTSGAEHCTGARDRFRAAVVGCGVGEALGLPVASATAEDIRARHGEDGLTEYLPAGHPAGRIGSETQLLLFSVEGMIRAGVARRRGAVTTPFEHVQHAYQRWLHTQHLSWPRAAGRFRTTAAQPDGPLVQHRALFRTRNPGRTMMRTLIAVAKGQREPGTPEDPVNDSQGPSAVVRAVPAALWSDDPARVFDTAVRLAALTHGHPSAHLSAGALGVVVLHLLGGAELPDAVARAREELAGHPEHEPVARRLDAAVRLAASGSASPEERNHHLGTGWQAAEALALGVHAALAAVERESPFEAGLAVAVNQTGNSAAVGAVCGSLLGALLGTGGIAERWTDELELHAVLEGLGADAAAEFGPAPPEWGERYPAT